MKRLASACASACASAGALLLAGCGGSAGDLLSITARGGAASATHIVVVSGDGRGSCDRGPLKELPSDRVIAARAVERDAADLAKRSAIYPPVPGARSYTLRTKAGEVRWSERARGLPPVLPRAQLLDVQLQQGLC
jgi:hypothetical protein